ncbi:biotin--[acetyl-CoA-carboxylase] ligase [Agilicoccus flavus]|uniref:biotin--[acetyl-CoA-carboxylase] ligase n=1 Tax=Agilicoccus flavus TaxID=2775968 RepID=UPI001CF68840|nr:biotin--[acetyl-CoA-carboxylase] ligase [Agilicoccus flavus]
MTSIARLGEELRAAGRPWRHVDVLGEVDSTNAVSLRDPRAWRVVVADTQSAGRGRRGRTWASPPGTSLAMSLTLPMPADHPAPGWIPLLAGLGVRDALAGLLRSSGRFALKWPNDVLAADVDGTWRKVCGVLAQAVSAPTAGAWGSSSSAGGGLVVVGVGINVGVEDLPVPTATSLHRLPRPAGMPAPDRAAVALAVADAVAPWYARWAEGDVAPLHAAYRAACATIGRDVVVHLPGGDVRGRATGVGDDGALLLDTPSGRRVLSAGDVVHVRPGESDSPREGSELGSPTGAGDSGMIGP